MKAEIVNRRYIKCPTCGETHEVEHLFEMIEDYKHTAYATTSARFGPWYCDDREKCNTKMSGYVHDDGTVSVDVIPRPSNISHKALVLFKLRDLYVVVDGYTCDENGDIENWDFLFHSHQCPTNIFSRLQKIFDSEHDDPHGILRFMASIRATDENIKEFDESINTVPDLLKFFNSDGFPKDSDWPEENKGVLGWLAQLKKTDMTPQ